MFFRIVILYFTLKRTKAGNWIAHRQFGSGFSSFLGTPHMYVASAPLLYETTIKTIIKKIIIEYKRKNHIKKEDEHRILWVKSIIKFVFSYFLPLSSIFQKKVKWKVSVTLHPLPVPSCSISFENFFSVIPIRELLLSSPHYPLNDTV